MDLADATFKWKCPDCGDMFEESNPSLLEVRKQSHKRTCPKRSPKERRSGQDSSD